MKKDKKTMILTIVAVVTLIAVVMGATFAYFTAQGGKASQTDISVKTSTTDSLAFSTGDPISFTAIQSTFKKGDGNKAGSTYAKAVLKANDSTNHATANYYVYLDITNNDFEYTTEAKTAELLLTVIDPDGNPVTEIEGLDYVTVNGLSGFDVTEKSGLLKLVDNHEIVSEGTKEESWNITLTLVNLDSDQSKNAGKNFNASVEITKENKSGNNTLVNYVKSQYTGVQGANNLYLHDSTLENGANDGSYRYAGSSETTNNFVCFGYDSTDGTCPTDYLYRIIGVFDNQVKLIKYDCAKSSLLGTDGDYKEVYPYNTSNYKGSLAVSDIGGYMWNYNGLSDHTGNNQFGSNTWSTSLLNTVNLNTNYLNNIGSKWGDKIATHIWKVGGNTDDNIKYVTPSVAYTNEITSPATNTTYEAKIGLMYVSDYGYAAAPSAWTTILNDYDSSSIKSVNWMYMGLYELTISSDSSSSYYVWYVHSDGFVSYDLAIVGYGQRPVLYLTANTKYQSGDGTKDKPIILQ